MCDLASLAPTFRGFALNTVTKVGTAGTGSGLSGCTIDSIDHDGVEIRQFTEPLALMNGVDVGGVWLGGRHVVIHGTIYGVSRAAALASLSSLRSVMLPEAGTFGYYALVLTEGTLMVRPNGLHVVWNRNTLGGKATDALAIPWYCTMYAKNPDWA